jgi:predicted RNA-binding Zn-ribbon protein involved in translation (DUF1610 family)
MKRYKNNCSAFIYSTRELKWDIMNKNNETKCPKCGYVFRTVKIVKLKDRYCCPKCFSKILKEELNNGTKYNGK